MPIINIDLEPEINSKFEDYCRKNHAFKKPMAEKLITELFVNGKVILNDERIIDLSKLRDDIWNKFSIKLGKINKSKEEIVAGFILKFVKSKKGSVVKK